MLKDNLPKDSLIDKILEIELKMFVSVPSLQKASCQEDPDGFRVMRSSQFAAWSENTLDSYYNDLKEAVAHGKNLMTLKYARMDNLIPPLHESAEVNRMIDDIIIIQVNWQQDMILKYPALMGRGRPVEDENNNHGLTSFKTYLRCELETYSLITLTFLFQDVMQCNAQKINMTEKVYKLLVKGLGYESLEEAEEQTKKNYA